MNRAPKLVYVYREGETPEERLRNKIQPLFTLVSILEAKGEVTPEVIALSKATVNDIIDLLYDIVPFYTANCPEHFTFIQDDTLT